MTRSISRRGFFKTGAALAASAVLAGCQAPQRWVVREPYVSAPEEQPTGVATWYASACRLCPAGCGIVVRVMNGRAVKIEGNPEHPLNQGKLCAQGQAGLQLLYNPDRFVAPYRQNQRGAGQFEKTAWTLAMELFTSKVQAAGSNLAVWTGSHVSAHLYGLFQRFTEAVGAPAPLVFDLEAAVQGHGLLSGTSQAFFGRGDLAAYDLGAADVVFSFGSDILGAGPSPTRYGVEYGRFRSQRLGMRGYLVQLEPRMSSTGAKADRWVTIRPGSEGVVAQALARIAADQKLGPADRLARWAALAGGVDVAAASQASDVPVADLTALARVLAEASHPLAIPGSAMMGHDNAAEAVAAVQALNTAAGTAGQAGGMSLSAALPADLPARPTPASYGDALALIDRMKAGQVQVLLVYGADPVYDLPAKAGLLDALSHVPYVVSFASIPDDTTPQADLILPDRTYLESWGYDVVAPNFGTPAVTSQQPVVQPLYDLRATGDVLLSAAQKIAPGKLNWADEVAYLKEVVTRLPAGAYGGSGADVLWARFLQHGGWWPALAPASAALQPAATPAAGVQPATLAGDPAQFPYYLCLYEPVLLRTGRLANLPWLQGSADPMTTIAWESWVEMHPDTMAKLGVQKGDILRVTTAEGAVEVPVYPFPGIRPDTIAIPFGQGHAAAGRYAQGHGVNPLDLVPAQASGTAKGLPWASMRAQVSRTGKSIQMATLEWTEGVLGGFINGSSPGGL